MIKIMAATRLLADWFADLSPGEQKTYVEQHPDSKFAVDYDNAREQAWPAEKKSQDVERISQLRKQIGYLDEDIADMESSKEDAGQERSQRRVLQKELEGLTKVEAGTLTPGSALNRIQAAFPLGSALRAANEIPWLASKYGVPVFRINGTEEQVLKVINHRSSVVQKEEVRITKEGKKTIYSRSGIWKQPYTVHVAIDPEDKVNPIIAWATSP